MLVRGPGSWMTHVAAAAPGPRASRFQDVLDRSLAHTLAKIGWDNFAACYPTIAAQAPSPLRAVQKQMVDRLGALCKVRLPPPPPFILHVYLAGKAGYMLLRCGT